jgi:hypothetical protein
VIGDPQSVSPMSAISGGRGDRVSIRLFETGRQLTEHIRTTIRHSESTLVLGEYLQFEDPDISTGHVLGTTARTCQDSWQRLINGSLNYLLVQLRDFVRLRARLDLTNIKILIYDESAVAGIERLEARQITLLLTRAQFIRLKIRVGPF